MNFYQVFLADGTEERMVVSFMATEQFRLANGGKSNKEIVLEEAKKKFGNKFAKIVRLSNQEVVFRKA